MDTSIDHPIISSPSPAIVALKPSLKKRILLWTVAKIKKKLLVDGLSRQKKRLIDSPSIW